MSSLPVPFALRCRRIRIGEKSNDPASIAAGARIGTEQGADIIKMRLTRKPEDIQVIQSAKKTVIAIGGPKADDMLEYFMFIQHCIEVGAKGVAIGRNIVQNEDPADFVAGLNKIIHLNGTAEEAYQVYINHSLT